VLRTSLVSPACLISLVISELSVACPVMGEPTVEALVDAGLSSIRTPLRLTVYRRDDDPSGGVCIASLDLALSELPSRRLVPRPRELADAVAPVAEVFGVKSCAIGVSVEDDLDRAVATDSEPEPDGEDCRRGIFEFDGSSWSEVEDDASCW